MKANEVCKAVVNELKKLKIPIYYIHNQNYVKAPYICFNYSFFPEYYANDQTLYAVTLVTINLIMDTIDFDEVKRIQKLIQNTGFKRVGKWVSEEKQYILAFEKNYIVWE